MTPDQTTLAKPDQSISHSIADFERIIPNTALEPLGTKVTAVDAESLSLRIPITDASRQPFGLLHGGISLLLAESAASMHSCWGIDLNSVFPVGIEINGSHLRSASSGFVIATAQLLRRSKTLAVHEVKIIHEETNELLCVCRVTNYYKRRSSFSP
ncbi:MAG TPA: PaaI family thioesterase [Chthoniobacterales bacterium]|nr:PaaI family thioesterase [Chthoniobacterales bacterium]